MDKRERETKERQPEKEGGEQRRTRRARGLRYGTREEVAGRK